MAKRFIHGNKYLNWTTLLQAKRQRSGRSHSHKEVHDSTYGFQIKDERNPFEKDFQRIILAASFRRLQDKTQVFPLDKSDFVRTRLTHSLEVSSFAKAIGQLTMRFLPQYYADNKLPSGLSLPTFEQQAAIEDILLSAGLLHDIGNPPFGHYGETTIRAWFKRNLPNLQFRNLPLSDWLSREMQADLLQFEGNAQALRLLGKLHFLVDENGMNLTYPVLHTLIKYPVDSLHTEAATLDVGRAKAHKGKITRHKIGYFYAEQDLFREITTTLGTALIADEQIAAATSANGNAFAKQLSYDCPDSNISIACRHPLSFLLEAADDIAYRSADIEDALRKGKLTYHILLQELENAINSGKDNLAVDLAALQAFYQHALQENYPEPELYATQNWLIRAQSRMLHDLSQSFCEHYIEIMAGAFEQDLATGRYAGSLLDLLGQIAFNYVFTSTDIVRLEVAADTIINTLLDRFIKAAINYEQSSTYEQPVDDRLMRLVSKNYRHSYAFWAQGKPEGEKLYLRILLITDFICGMTDNYARDLYQQLQGIGTA